METWNVWENLHWRRVGENERRAIKDLTRLLSQPLKEPKPEPQSAIPFSTDHDITVPKKEGDQGQFEMDFS